MRNNSSSFDQALPPPVEVDFRWLCVIGEISGELMTAGESDMGESIPMDIEDNIRGENGNLYNEPTGLPSKGRKKMWIGSSGCQKIAVMLAWGESTVLEINNGKVTTSKIISEGP